MNTEDVDGIQQRLGNGRFQFLSFLLLGLIYSRGAWHVFGIMFLAGDPGHKCALPDLKHGHTHTDSVSPSTFVDSVRSESESNASVSWTDGTIPDRRAVSTLPTSIDMNSNMLYAFRGDSVEVMKSNWTAETCGVSFVTLTDNGSSVTVMGECPHGWAYGSEFDSTVLSEWNLVCDRDYLVELSITVFMIGATVGAMAILPLADRFGRKRVMMLCLLGQACVGTATAFVRDYTFFTALRFVIGMLNIGVGISSYVLMTETFPAQKRTVMSIAFQAFWAVGVMTVAGFGYLVRNWRQLELLLSLPNLLALPFCWMLPESLPWLVSRKSWAEARATVKTIAKVNSLNIAEFSGLFADACSDDSTPAESILFENKKQSNQNVGGETKVKNGATGCESNHTAGLSKSENPSKTEAHAAIVHHDSSQMEKLLKVENGHGDKTVVDNICSEELRKENGDSVTAMTTAREEENTFLDLFRHPRMRLYSCIMFFLFFVNSLGYFGISFSVPILHGNPFVNLCIMGVVEIPADFICVLVSQRVGRRYPNALFLLLCGISNIAALFIPHSLVALKLVFVMLGKFAITAAYSTIYLYSAEIFPTAIRNQGMGMSSVFENIGGISAPFMVLAAKSIAELPLVVFGVLSIAGALLTLFLPETHNRPLPQTVGEVTKW
ncbi:organic cation transporter protein-like [Littorina saxatilis]|uniref:Major facilitator superfamily (MFS) profile domain-containing protein n=1 Tax=Littorina saxatilis TaxID=31220 RepID=A0AAN9GR73_9CAEN